jgi:hypothetical protein
LIATVKFSIVHAASLQFKVLAKRSIIIGDIIKIIFLEMIQPLIYYLIGQKNKLFSPI